MFILLYKIDGQQRAKAEHAKVPVRASGHKTGTVALPAHTCTATLGDTSPTSVRALHANSKLTHPMRHRRRGRHHKTQSSVKCVGNWYMGISSGTAEASFPKAFLRTGGHNSQLCLPSGCGWLRFGSYPSYHRHPPPPPLTSLS